MTAYAIRTSRPHESILPRAHRDGHQRYLAYGPVQSMDSDNWVKRLFGWR